MEYESNSGSLPPLSIMSSPLMPDFSFDAFTSFSPKSPRNILSPTTGSNYSTKQPINAGGTSISDNNIVIQKAANSDFVVPSLSVLSKSPDTRLSKAIELNEIATTDTDTAITDTETTITDIETNISEANTPVDAISQNGDYKKVDTQTDHAYESDSTQVDHENNDHDKSAVIEKDINMTADTKAPKPSDEKTNKASEKGTRSMSNQEIASAIALANTTIKSRLSCNMSSRPQRQSISLNANRYRASFVAPVAPRPDSVLRSHPTEQELRSFVQTLITETDDHQLSALGIDRILSLAGWEFVLSCCRMADHVGRDFCRRAIMGAVGNAMLAKKPALSLAYNRQSAFMDTVDNISLSVPTHFMRVSSTDGMSERDIQLNQVTVNFIIGAYPATQMADTAQRLIDALMILERRLITDQVVDHTSWSSIQSDQISSIKHHVPEDFHRIFGQESRITLRDAQIFGVTSNEAKSYTCALHFFSNFCLPQGGILGRSALDAEDYIHVLIIDPAFSLKFTRIDSEDDADMTSNMLNLWRNQTWSPSGITCLHDGQSSDANPADGAHIADGSNNWYRPVICVERRVAGELLTFVVGCSRGNVSRDHAVTKLYTSAYLALKQQELWLGKRAYKRIEQTPYVYAYLIDRTRIELFYMTGSRTLRSEVVTYTFDHVHTIDIAASGSQPTSDTVAFCLNVDNQEQKQYSPFSMTAILQACTVFTTMAACVHERLGAMENGTRGRIYDNFRSEVDKCALLPKLEMNRVVCADKLIKSKNTEKTIEKLSLVNSKELKMESNNRTESVLSAETTDKPFTLMPIDRIKEKKQKYASSIPSFNGPVLELLNKHTSSSGTDKKPSSFNVHDNKKTSSLSDSERRMRALAGMDRIMFSETANSSPASVESTKDTKEQPALLNEKKDDGKKNEEDKQIEAKHKVLDTESIVTFNTLDMSVGQTVSKSGENAMQSALSDLRSSEPRPVSLSPEQDGEKPVKASRRSGVYGQQAILVNSKSRTDIVSMDAHTFKNIQPATAEQKTMEIRPVSAAPILNEQPLVPLINAQPTPTRQLPASKGVLEASQNEPVQSTTESHIHNKPVPTATDKASTHTDATSSKLDNQHAPPATHTAQNTFLSANPSINVARLVDNHQLLRQKQPPLSLVAPSMSTGVRSNTFRHSSFNNATAAASSRPALKAQANGSPLTGFVFPGPPPPLTLAQRKSIFEGADPRAVLSQRPSTVVAVPRVPTVAAPAAPATAESMLATSAPQINYNHTSNLSCDTIASLISMEAIELPNLPFRIPRVVTPQEPIQTSAVTMESSTAAAAPALSPIPLRELPSASSAPLRGPPSARQAKSSEDKRTTPNSSLSNLFTGCTKSDTTSINNDKDQSGTPVKKASSFRNLRSLFR
ncbi:hypothetical protein BDF19DRAFT_497357 [Syncephalis fuscata]|nr:hypothetical protein BDF19DRAFT_497357 [Syncephalis fuscata]